MAASFGQNFDLLALFGILNDSPYLQVGASLRISIIAPRGAEEEGGRVDNDNGGGEGEGGSDSDRSEGWLCANGNCKRAHTPRGT